MEHNRERGVILRRLDTEALGRQALAHLKVMAPTVDWTAASFQYGYAVAQTDNGLYVVCTEGVGWEVTHSKPLILDVIASWKDADGLAHHSMSPSAAVYLSPYEVTELMNASTEDIDLADLVREFGDRLEVNFSIWHDRLTAKAKS